ncbi:mucin-21 [Periplaneta americana]|uniref:mucin-21 n=1 Tax=Periplaneta americana TaxID=6978 RepID=UPI0037E7642B
MWQPVTLLTLVLCQLLLHPALGFPFARQALAKSARSDDLISGSDFLSVFIGASVPRSRPISRSRNYNKVSKRPDSVTSEESYTSSSYADNIPASSETTAFGIRTVPKDSNSLPPEPLADSSSILSEPDNSHVGNEQDIVSKAATDSADLSTPLTKENDPLDTGETQKSSIPNASLDGVNAQYVGLEPEGASSITSSKRIEFVSNSQSEKPAGKPLEFERDIEKDEVAITATSTPSLLTDDFSDKNTNSSSDTFGVEELSPTFVTSNGTFTETEAPSKRATETESDFSNVSEIPVENETFDKNPTPTREENNVAWPTSADATGQDGFQNQTHQVVSVRVSSSVARAQQNNKIEPENKDIFSTFLDAFVQTDNKAESPIESASLVTEEQPAATAIQRSQFSVEEASPSSSIISVHQETSSSNIQSRQSSFSSPGAIESPLNPQSSPVSYHTSVSTATSGSRVQFYSEPPSYHRTGSSVAETVQQAVVAHQQHQPQQQNFKQVFQGSGGLNVASHNGNGESNYGAVHQIQSNYQTSSPQRSYSTEGLQGSIHQQSHDTLSEGQQGDTNRAQKSYESHQEPPERNFELPEHNYGTPERSYANPEQNYEVDESVSVMTNGRVHGVQFPPATTPGQQADTALREFNTPQGQSRDPNSKFGYVVEGRNFRKYQVEERTSDGFIVGEYGVVSHDDGSLRGVRYTADGTINPRLIYDALVKFLSL